jgi:uncharacterized MAPEG superfamily protein
MPLEIQMLVCSVALFFLTIVIQATAGVMQFGLVPMLGNRDDIAAPTGFAARAKRCVGNSIEAMLMFAPLVLAAVATQQADRWSGLGAQIFLYSRVGYVASYLIGIPFVRTAFWTGGAVGTGLVFYALYV